MATIRGQRLFEEIRYVWFLIISDVPHTPGSSHIPILHAIKRCWERGYLEWGSHYRTAGNFQRRKLSRFCGYSQKFSLRNLGAWHLMAAQLATPVSNPWKFSLWKSYFPPFMKVFSHKSFPLYVINKLKIFLPMQAYPAPKWSPAVPVLSVLMATAVDSFHIPDQTSPKLPWPSFFWNWSVDRSISHSSLEEKERKTNMMSLWHHCHPRGSLKKSQVWAVSMVGVTEAV